MTNTIATRFGAVVRIVARHSDYDQSGWVDVEFRDGLTVAMHVSHLQALGGPQEIAWMATWVPYRKPEAKRG